MKKIFYLLLTIACLYSCTKKKANSDGLLHYIPNKASVIIKVNNYQSFKSGLKNNDFLKSLHKTTIYKDINSKIGALENLNPTSELLVSFSELGKDFFELTVVTKKHSDLFINDSISQQPTNSINYQGKKIHNYKLNSHEFYATTYDSVLVASSSKLIIENLIRAKGVISQDAKLSLLYKASNNSKPATLFINNKNAASLVNSIMTHKTPVEIDKLTEWMSLDATIQQDMIQLYGIATANDSIPHFVDIFKKTKPYENKLQHIAPLNATSLISFSFDDYKTIKKSKEQYLDKTQSKDTLFNTVEEIGSFYINSSKAAALFSYNSSQINEYLLSKEKSSAIYQEQNIIALQNPSFISDNFSPILSNFKANFYTLIEDSFIFSEEENTLQTIISNYQNSATFAKNSSYNTIKEELANESTILAMASGSGIKKRAATYLTPKNAKELEKAAFDDYAFASQVIVDHNFYHLNIIIKKKTKREISNAISQLFTVQLDADLATTPQFVTNHITKKKEIVVQDNDNNLYLIATDGKLLWKKQLQGKIQGKIAQVDLYKNGKLQLAFTTNNQFIVLDRNGKEVAPFTLTFDGGNLNPLAVFDYESSRNYRFVITQGTKVFMYNNQGKIVTGFTFKSTESAILRAPKHFRINTKDYLVFMETNGKLHILDRRGASKLDIKEQIAFSDNDIYFYNNKFSLTNTKGELIQINTKGGIAKKALNLNKDHYFDASSKSLATINDNQFNIKGNSNTLDIGVYTAPKIFYLYDKIYVTTTDIENNSVYLFNSDATLIKNFPIYGNSEIDMADIDNDKRLELVVKNESNSFVVYKLN